MRAPILVPILVLVLASATTQAAGIYQWKDAKGVTHYTDTPPPGSEYKQRRLYNEDPELPANAAAKPAENPNCAAARYNVALLNSKQGVKFDSDGDGKPDKALSDNDRSSQLALAQATLNANNCSNATPASSGR